MSSHFDSQLSTQGDWQGHFPCLPPDSNGFSQSYETGNEPAESSRPRSIGDEHGQPGIDSAADQSSQINRPQEGDTSTLEHLPTPEQTDQQTDTCSATTTASMKNGASPSTSRAGLAMATEPLNSSSGTTGQGICSSIPGANGDNFPPIKEEDDEILDDDDVDVDGEVPGQPMTAAERTAQRRKMKRFR